MHKLSTIPESIAGVVYYSQRDPRWADVPYSAIGDASQTIGRSGCVPTNQAMIRSHFETDVVLPPEMAAWNLANDYRTEQEGTDSLRSMTAFAAEFGYEIKQVVPDASIVRRALGRKGLVHITAYASESERDTNLGTPGGHAVLLRSAHFEGDTLMVHVHNSDNVDKSFQPWELQKVLEKVDPERVYTVFYAGNSDLQGS